jgi:hypothetical protein
MMSADVCVTARCCIVALLQCGTPTAGTWALCWPAGLA